MAGPLRVERDVEVGRWLQRSLADDGTVAVVVPPIFEAYARILHPATLETPTGATDAWGGVERAEREITWAQAASLVGDRVAQPEPWSQWLARFGEDSIDLPAGTSLDGVALPPGSSIRSPHEGDIPVRLLAALAVMLVGEHGDAEVLAAVWEGRELDVHHPGAVFGWSDREPSRWGRLGDWLAARRQRREMQAEHEQAMRASIDPEVTRAMDRRAVLELPREQQGRGHVLLRGRLASFTDPAWERDAGLAWRPEWPFQGRTPNAIWPVEPHSAPAWFVATELDLDVTHVGGSADLIGRLLADPAFETERIRPTDPLVVPRDPR